MPVFAWQGKGVGGSKRQDDMRWLWTGSSGAAQSHVERQLGSAAA